MVLLHGLGGSGRYWRRVAEELAGRVRLFAPDLLGFGHSPWPKIEYRVDDHLDALDHTLEQLGLVVDRDAESVGAVPAPLLAGHSAGASLALAWAARHPERFRGLVLSGLPCYRSPEEARRHIAGLDFLAYATVARPALGRAICSFMCAARPLSSWVAPLVAPYLPADVARDGVLHTWRSYSRTIEHVLIEQDLPALADRIAPTGLPVRLVHGEQDHEAPADRVAELAQRAGWPLELVPGASHNLPINHPRRCAEAILAAAGTDRDSSTMSAN